MLIPTRTLEIAVLGVRIFYAHYLLLSFIGLFRFITIYTELLTSCFSGVKSSVLFN